MTTTQTPSGLAPGSPLAAPRSVFATNNQSTKIAVSWDAVSGALSYSVWRGTSIDGTGASSIASGITATNYDDTSATADTGYYYFVKAVHATGTSGFSGVATGWRTGTAPAALASATIATDSLTGSVSVTWGASAGALGYIIKRGGFVIGNVAAGTLAFSDTTGTPGTVYTYEVIAWNYEGYTSGGTDSGHSVAVTPPSAPTSVAATDGLEDVVTITWAASAGAVSYEVWRSPTSSSAGATLLASGITSLTYDDIPPAYSTNYWYFVKATNTGGTSGFSSSDIGYMVAPPTPPSAPTGVNATDGNAGSTTITWTPVSGATSYSVWRSPNSSSAFATSLASGLTSPTYDDTTGSYGVTYWYFVKATNSAGTSGFSTGDSGVANAPGSPPADPTGCAASDTQVHQITVTCTPVSGADTYSVWRNTSASSAGATQIASGLTSPSYVDTGISDDTTYYYWFKATNAYGTSGFSNMDSGFSQATPVPSAPSSVSASDGNISYIHVAWVSSSYATSYSVWRNTSPTSAGATLVEAGTSLTTFDDYTATPGVNYYYFVKAINAYGTSGFSSASDVGYSTAPVEPPTSVSASDGTYGDKVVITWAAAAGATGYEIWRSSVSSFGAATLLATVGTVTSYDDTSVTDTSTWYYWLKTLGPGGPSGFSPSSGAEGGYAGAPATPSISSVTTTVVDYVRIIWGSASLATDYSVYRNSINDFGSATLIASGLTGTSYDDTPAFDTTFYYWVVAHNTVGSSSPSAVATGYSPGTLPDVPVMTGASVGTGTMFLGWSAATLASSYDAGVSDNPDLNGGAAYSTYNNLGNVTSYTWNPSGLSADGYSPQYYAIRGRNRFGVSAWSTSQGPFYQT